MWLIKAHTSQEAPTSTSGSSSPITSIDFYLHIGPKVFSYLIYLLSIMIYFGILIYDFWKKKITKKDFIIYFLYFFIDIILIIILLHLIMILMSDFPSV